MHDHGNTCKGELHRFKLQRGHLLGNQSVPSPGRLLVVFPKEKLTESHTCLGVSV